ncbi:uncharacterized protein LOC117131649 [Brassica rapa]|uniref:uncharacterized protein LOC117131649 n=1 Tax=Brassica campestris TaxID=3711 RepID=UPI00142D980E|nr:uncharacterized protein LOC117131649 [Brassica rapa]
MADVTRAPRTKDFGSTSIQCPMLSSTNYTVWSMRMKVLLRVHEVWDTIEPGSDDQKKNDVAIALLFQSVPETLILQVGEQTASKEIWNAIKSRHLGADRVREARLQTLMAEFDRLKMDDSDTVDDFAGKISGLSSKATSLGENIEESKMVKKFEMSDLGKLTYYLGIEVIQGADGIRIKQERYAQGILCDTKMEVCNTTHVGVCNTTHGGVCDTKVEACDTTHVPMESRFSKDEDEPEINQLGVEQKADILPRAHVRKMADVTRVIIAVSFSHKTHRNLSEEVMRRLYKNWADSKKKRYGSKESIRSNLEKDVNSMGGFAHHGVVEDDYLMIKFKQMRSLIGVQEIDLPNSSWN